MFIMGQTVTYFPKDCLHTVSAYDDFDVIQYRRSTHPLCATCTTSQFFEPRPYHAATLLRGLAKTLGNGFTSLHEMNEEALTASTLDGKEVYFWGCGEMYHRKRHVFANTKPRCILADFEGHPSRVYDLPVRHPDDVLLSSDDILPIVIFAGDTSRETILQTIKEKYPEVREVYACISK